LDLGGGDRLGRDGIEDPAGYDTRALPARAFGHEQKESDQPERRSQELSKTKMTEKLRGTVGSGGGTGRDDRHHSCTRARRFRAVFSTPMDHPRSRRDSIMRASGLVNFMLGNVRPVARDPLGIGWCTFGDSHDEAPWAAGWRLGLERENP
jgi:hypothetical protein